MDDDKTRLLDDDVVYLRTSAGKAELVSASRRLSRLERRSLAAVTGYSSLRTLMDLGAYGADTAAAVMRLAELGLIVVVESSDTNR